MHQSGRFDSMLNNRSRPHAGIHVTSRSIASRPAWRSVVSVSVKRTGVSRLMNHCDVARKITGLWERLLDVRVRVEHALAREHLDRVQGVPARAHRGIDVKAVTDAGIEVVRAVA